MRVTELDTLDSIVRVGKGLARQIRRQLLVRTIDTAIALADPETLLSDILELARKAAEA